ncbi:MAG: ribokinase [Acidimicrobiales bacterium]
MASDLPQRFGVHGPPDAGPRLGVIGSCNVDLIVRCRRLARPGETVVGDDVVRLPGGKGANQAAALAALGADVSLLCSVGQDEDGEWLLRALRGRGVNVDLVRRSPRPTGAAFITVDDAGENEIVVSLGANADLELGDVDLGRFDVVLAQLEIAESIVAAAAQRSPTFVLNAAPARPVSAETLAHCAVVIANEVEAESLELSGIEHCVVTMGERGAAHYALGREVARCVAPRVTPVDTVGAGDVFCAAYALQFARGASALDALRFAVVAATLATRAQGAQGALPTREEVDAALARAS